MWFVQQSGVTFSVILCLWCIISDAAGEEKYVTKYDDIDLDELLGNERLMKNYIKCLLYEGPCTPDGLELRSTIPDAIITDCAKCSEKQKAGTDKVLHYLIENRPDDWNRLEKIYDPDEIYKNRYFLQQGNLAVGTTEK